MRIGLGASAAGFALAALAAPTAAAAQTGPLAPTREEVTRAPPQPEPPQTTQLDVEGGIERAPCALDTPEYQAIRFTPRDVQFEGLQGLTAGDLTPAYAGLIGTEQPVSAICEIRDRAATILRSAGYIASVEVPEQRIADGSVRFKVLMAKLVQVRVRGDAGRAEQTIAGYLERLTDQPVFNRYDAERYLLLASDLPGYNVRLTLRPAGTAPGEVVGDVTVQRLAGVLDANVQNYGSQELGRWGGLLRAQLFGLTGLGDRTTVAFFETFNLKEQRTIQAGHDFRLGSEGLTLSGDVTYSWARPDIDGGADVRATTLFATGEVSYPFIRRQSDTLRGAIGFDLVNQDVDIEDADLTRDRLRVAFARLNADAASLDFSRRGSSLAEPVWRASAVLELRRGLDILNATDCGDTGSECLGPGEVLPSRAEADGTATVVRGSIYGEYRPARLVTLVLGLRGQWADDPLLSFEEFSAGNYTVGRGYDPGSLLGDRGIGAQAEVRLGSLVPAGPRTAAFEGYAFFDYARISNRDRLFVVEGGRRLSSIGAGLRTVFRGFNLDAAYAIPLKRVGPFDEKPDHRLLISLTTRLWPWSFQ